MAASLAVVAAPADLELTKAEPQLAHRAGAALSDRDGRAQGVLEEANVSPVEAMVDV